MSAYLGSTKVWEKADENGWVRPSDWLDLPSISPTEQKIAILHAVWPTTDNFVSFTLRGAVTINWGDGNIENVADNTQAYHNYSYSNSALDGTLSVRGYKQAIITITPQSAQNITSIDFQKKYLAELQNAYYSGFLDLVVSAPNCTNLTVGGAFIAYYDLERVRVLSTGAITTLVNFFQSCFSLMTYSLSGATLSSVVNLSYMFYLARSIQKIDLSNLSFGNITSIAHCFRDASNVSVIKFPSSLNVSAVTDVSHLFNGTRNIREVDLSGLNWGAVTNTTSAFSSTSSLAELVFPCPVSFNVTSCMLSATALDALYTSLPTVSGKTIYVKGNYGITGHTPSIATAKGWTVDTTT